MSQSPVSLSPVIDRVCDDFEHAWKAGSPPKVESLLAEAQPEVLPTLLRELLKLERYYRERQGNPLTAAEATARFACLGDWVGPVLQELELPTAGGPVADPYATVTPSLGDPYATTPYVPDDPFATVPPADCPESLLGPIMHVPGYEVLGELGRGGMGVVYRARQTALNRVVALKMILSGGHAGEEERLRFLAEAEAIARVKHPGIVQVFEFGSHGGLPFFSMEFCPAGSLSRKLAANPLPAREAATVVEQIARAVAAAHEAKIVHRDLKPGNVLLGDDGPKVTDFGLAKRVEVGEGLTCSGDIIGTPNYMAPEQARGESRNVGPPADVWALGAILYECLTGRPPFKAATTFDTLLQVIGDEPARPSQLNPTVPADLEVICLKCLRKEAGSRYASAVDLAEDLGRWLAGEPILARPAGTLERATKWAQRNPTRAALAGTAALALAAMVVGAVLFGLVKQQESRDLTRRLAQSEKVKSLWKQGRDAMVRGDLNAAEKALVRAEAALDHDEDDQVRAEIEAELAQVRRQVRDQADRRERLAREKEAREQFARDVADLAAARDELLFLDLAVEESERAANRAEIRRRAEKALSPFGLSAAAGKRSPLDRLAAHFGPGQDRRDVVRNCREVLMVWAEAERERTLALLAVAEQLSEAESRPVPRSLYERRAACLDRLNDPVGAEAARAQAKRQPVTNEFDHFLLALDAYRAGDHAEAIAGCERALVEKPGYFWANYLLGIAHLLERRWASAEASLGACVALKPDVVWPRLLRATVRMSATRKNLAGAADDLNKAEEKARSRTERYMVHLGRAELAKHRQEWTAARQELTKAIACEPEGSPHAHAQLAMVCRGLKLPAEAMAALGEAIRRRPDDGQLYFARGQLHLDQEDEAAARADLTLATRLGRGDVRHGPWLVPAHLKLAALKYEAMEYEASLADSAAALKLAPGHPLAHRARVEPLLRLDRRVEAGAAMDVFLRRGGKLVTAADWMARGLIHEELREYPEAAHAFTQALGQDAKANATARGKRGWTYLRLKMPRKALTDFDLALKDAPDHTDALCGRAMARVMLDQTEAAVGDVVEALKVRPTPARLYQAACVYALAARSEDAARRPANARRFETKAVLLVEQTLRLLPEDQRARAWDEQVEKEPALKPLLRLPEMARLKRTLKR